MNNLSEEEKKAIEKIKKILFMFPESEDLKLLLNLIEKQQKEIEELKDKNNIMNVKINKLLDDNMELLRKDENTDKLNYKYIECPKVEAEWYKSESYINGNYISKDKIREKIEEYDKKKKDIPHDIDFKAFYTIAEIRNIQIDVLKTLLEED